MPAPPCFKHENELARGGVSAGITADQRGASCPTKEEGRKPSTGLERKRRERRPTGEGRGGAGQPRQGHDTMRSGAYNALDITLNGIIMPL